MFMVGSFASGLSEGLESGFKLGKDIQDRGYEQERRAAVKAELAKQKGGGGLPPLIDVSAKAPSPTEAPPMLTGSTNLTADGYDPNQTYAPAKVGPDGRVVTGATPALTPPWQSGIIDEKVPDNYKPAAKPAAAVPPATGPVVATAAIPPPTDAAPALPSTPLGGGAMAAGSPLNRWVGNTAAGIGNAVSGAVGFDPMTGLYPQGSPTYDPSYAPEQPTPSPLPPERGIGTVLPSRSALPPPVPRQAGRPPYRPGIFTLPGSQARQPGVPPISPSSPVFTAPIPLPIDPRTGLPIQQAVPY